MLQYLFELYFSISKWQRSPKLMGIIYYWYAEKKRLLKTLCQKERSGLLVQGFREMQAIINNYYTWLTPGLHTGLTPCTGELEDELRTIGKVDYRFTCKCDSDREVCMEMVEEHPRKTTYPHPVSQCTTDCKRRGKILLIVDTIPNNSPGDSKIIR